MMNISPLRIAFFACCFFTALNAQDSKIKLDYTVDYLVTNKKTNIKDTITVSFNKEGTYYYTNNKDLARSFGLTAFKGNPALVDGASIHLLLDTAETMLNLSFTTGKSTLFMALDIDMFPVQANEEKIVLGLKKIGMNNHLTVYELSESKKDKNPLIIEIDERKTFSSKNAFKFIMDKVFKQDSNIDLSSGIPVRVKTQEGKILLEAYHIDEKPKNITIQHNFIVEN